jgi:hypothetical protein
MAWFRGTQVGRGGLFDAENRFGSPCARTDSQKRIGWLVESRRFRVDGAAHVLTQARRRYASRGRLKIQIDNKSYLPRRIGRSCAKKDCLRSQPVAAILGEAHE